MQLHKKYLIIAAAAVTLAGSSGAQAAEKNYTLGSLAEGTTPFLVNTAFANAVNRHVPGHRIQVSAVGPATKHMLLVTRRKMDFTMAASTAYRLMFYEIGPFKKIKDGPERVKKMQILFSYPIGFYHPVVYESSGIKTFADIKGKTVFLGPPAGVATRNAAMIVEAMTGYKAGRDFKQVKLGWGPAQQAFQDKKFDVWITNTMPPSPAVSQLTLRNKIRLLPLDEAKFNHPRWRQYVAQPGRRQTYIDPKVYGKNMMNEKPVLSTGAMVGMSVRSDMDAELVYKMMKAFWDNISDAHALSKSMPDVLNLKTAVTNMYGDVHPGALRYYKEIGLEIPKTYTLTLAQRDAFRKKIKSKK
ncbi:MAG: TAXI family TRAP transporter solute-binding subunit [Rhodospirillales bacterium]